MVVTRRWLFVVVMQLEEEWLFPVHKKCILEGGYGESDEEKVVRLEKRCM